jgi:hypothetical protein
MFIAVLPHRQRELLDSIAVVEGIVVKAADAMAGK